MNGTNVIRVPRFLENEILPVGYNDPPNPYHNPPRSRYNLRALVNYALANGKSVYELTKEEVEQFIIK